MENHHTKYKNFISGGLSGVTEVALTHWIDNLKVRVQDADLIKKKINPMNLTLRELYWGFYPRVAGIIPMRTVFWGSQTIINDSLRDVKIEKNIKFLIAGISAGSIQTLIDNPIEAMKINLITNKNKLKNLNLFRGFTPTIIRNGIFCGVFNTIINNNKEKHKLVSGALGGVAASVISHPFDVLKTEVQKIDTKTRGIIDFIKMNVKNPKIFISGIIPRSILSLATMSIGYFSFDLFIKIL